MGKLLEFILKNKEALVFIGSAISSGVSLFKNFCKKPFKKKKGCGQSTTPVLKSDKPTKP